MRTFEDLLKSAKDTLGAAYLLVMPFIFLWAITQPFIFAYQTLTSRTASAFAKTVVIVALVLGIFLAVHYGEVSNKEETAKVRAFVKAQEEELQKSEESFREDEAKYAAGWADYTAPGT
jgi:cytosine/uracil/thiamine/allantoin permease